MVVHLLRCIEPVLSSCLETLPWEVLSYFNGPHGSLEAAGIVEKLQSVSRGNLGLFAERDLNSNIRSLGKITFRLCPCAQRCQ